MGMVMGGFGKLPAACQNHLRSYRFGLEGKSTILARAFIMTQNERGAPALRPGRPSQENDYAGCSSFKPASTLSGRAGR
jgi:hypothetical protein